MKRKYDSTIARIAGNIMSGQVSNGLWHDDNQALARRAVALARAIVKECILTEPEEESPSP